MEQRRDKEENGPATGLERGARGLEERGDKSCEGEEEDEDDGCGFEAAEEGERKEEEGGGGGGGVDVPPIGGGGGGIELFVPPPDPPSSMSICLAIAFSSFSLPNRDHGGEE